MKYKKGGERVLSIYLFVIYIIVGIGIVSGVILFYQGVDIREREAEVLTDAVIDCLVGAGKLKKEVMDNLDSLNEKISLDIEEFCHFDFKDNTKKYNGEERYAVKVELKDFAGGLEGNFPVSGNAEFLEFCDVKGKNMPKCNEKEVYVLYGKSYLLKINSAVSKMQNVGK